MARGSGRFDDPDNYLPMARRWRRARVRLKGRPTAYRPPLYPSAAGAVVTLGEMRSPGVSRCLHLGLGAGTVWMTAVAAERFGLSRAAGDGRGTDHGLRSGAGLAEPIGDDRDARGLPDRRGPGRAPAAVASEPVLGGLGSAWPGSAGPACSRAPADVVAGLVAPPGGRGSGSPTGGAGADDRWPGPPRPG